jgi:predicted ABC-class ATPase
MDRVHAASELRDILRRIDGRGYKAYKDVEGAWPFEGFVLRIDHAQGDPFATPSRSTILVESAVAALPRGALRTSSRVLGTAALLARTFAEVARSTSRSRGTGKSGRIRMEHPGQIVVPQTAVRISPEGDIEARLAVGLPARGRRVAGGAAIEMLFDDVPHIVLRSLRADAYEEGEIERHAAANEDAEALRETIRERGMVAFVADGASLPRRSGIDDRPMDPEEAVPFASPESLRVDVDLPNAGRVSGMGIARGVTLVVGGGFHGKSTLLRALQDGVYNHRPGDGRELVVCRDDAVKIRAEDGRSVAGVDISPFIDGLPLGKDTRSFSTPNASGSTSQAAAIVEALEAGAGVLMVDEDTSATNFMIRDRRMQTLVPKSGEPITPFVDRVRALHDVHGVSTVLVLGGSGDYLDVADRVIRMSEYLPADVTDTAAEIAHAQPTGRASEIAGPLERPAARRVDRGSVDPSRGRRRTSVKVPDDRTLLFGSETIDLAAVEQLAHRAQTRAVGMALAWAVRTLPDDVGTVAELLNAVEHVAEEDGLDAFTDWPVGDVASFRRFELAAALNRLRTLRVE